MALTADQCNKIIALKVKTVDPSTVYVLAVRGSDGKNDIGVFDDRAYVIYDHTLKGQWSMNTDPSSDVTGRAHLLPGVYTYRAGKHHINEPAPKGRPAFVQADQVHIHRTNQGDEWGWYGINLHDALGGTTSSLGCQTWKQYDGTEDFHNANGTGFRDVMYRILKVTPEDVMNQPTGCGPKFKYILVTGDDANKLLAS
jgi:hypothetical protein